MKDVFEFRVDWLERLHGSPAERETFGELEIRWGGVALTELLDLSAATVRSTTRVSMLHLGIWLMANWWRLRWEPLPPKIDPDWRMAHEIGGAGGGFVWPALQFASDGETIGLSLHDTMSDRPPVRYLRNTEGTISATTFERAVDDLMSLLLARLSSRRVDAADLAEGWRSVLAERRDPMAGARRRREALLGFDPDAIDVDDLSAIVSAGTWMGEAALEETMAAARAPAIRNTIEYLRDKSLEPGSNLDLAALEGVCRVWRDGHHRFTRPWERGAALAGLARREVGLSSDEPVSSERISELVGYDVMADQPTSGPLGAGFRSPDAPNRVKFHGIRRHPNSRRFEAARLLAEALDGPPADAVLPITDASTARQKVQRSFAQEFLCPTEGLVRLLPLPNPSDSDIEGAADHYGVSAFTVRSALVNRGLVDRRYLPA